MKENWRRMSLDSLPSCRGVYAIKAIDRWLYIGKAVSICARLKNKRHPAQITRHLKSVQMTYLYMPIEDSLGKAEGHLIRKYSPEWNGATSFEGRGRGPCCQIPLPNTSHNYLLILASIEAATTPTPEDPTP
jgi:excinuclease UvrABC nuclease subunit